MTDRLVAKLPYQSMHLQLTFTIVSQTDEQDKFNVKHDDKPVQIKFRDDMQSWLDTCSGKWWALPSTWEIQFEKEEDYVKFCLEWL